MSKRINNKQVTDIINILSNDCDDTHPLDVAIALMELAVSILEASVTEEASFENDELLFSAEGDHFKISLTAK